MQCSGSKVLQATTGWRGNGNGHVDMRARDGMGCWGMGWHGMVWDGRQTAANSIQQEVMGWLVGRRYSGGFTEIDEGPWSNLSFLSQNPKPC